VIPKNLTRYKFYPKALWDEMENWDKGFSLNFSLLHKILGETG